MPPKQASKAELAKKQKIVEDKTFGLKNKNKSKNVQNYVQNLKQSVQSKPDSSKVLQKKKKEEDKAKEKELNDLFKIAVTQPKVPVGVDPKSIVCEFYKVGQCAKGFKCKFSHDLNVQRKGEKINIYSDKRDRVRLKVVLIFILLVVSFFKKQWRTVIKKLCRRLSQRQRSISRISLLILFVNISWKLWKRNNMAGFGSAQMVRAKLTTSTPMTPELFMEWKKRKIAERDESLAAQKAERAKNDRMSGRELFMSDAGLFVDDAEAYEKYQREEESDVPENKTNNDSAAAGPSTSATSAADAETLPDDDDDDDELDMDELNELEASLAKTSIQIQEPNAEA
ncbi:hypothetical protein CRYUN_Cryun09bG0028800 [Craigia yunnanensis]